MSLPVAVPSFKGRIALVTGASRGIGRAVALGFAKAGAHVVAVARTTGALEELDDEIKAVGGVATLVPLDLSKGDKIDALGPSLYQRFERLDILVGNAGVLGPVSPLNHISVEQWAMTLNVNVSANWRLIRTLDPLLRMSDAGRAIFVTSGTVSKARAYRGPYTVSKAALDALVRTYAAEAANSSVRVNLLSPGPVRTKMRETLYPGEDPNTLPDPDVLVPTFLKMASPDFTANGTTVVFDRGV